MRKWSLKTKLISVMMAANAIGMFIVALAFINNNLSLLDSRLDSRISTELDLMSQNIGPALLFKDKQSAGEMLATLSVDPAIVSAKLYPLGSDKPLAEYLKPAAKNRESFLTPVQLLQHSRKVVVDGEVQGRLDMLVSTREVKHQTQQLFLFSLAVLLVATTLVLLSALKIQGIITGPIIALNRLSRDVAKSGDYSLRSNIDKEDEIGELAREMNRMLAQIQNRDIMLEKLVEQRTAELEKLAEEFRHRAFHDSLTGLPNRAFLSEYFITAAGHARRNQTRMFLMLLDLDNFKTINDSLGHNFGDELLKVVARRLKSALRKDDVIVRLGGDEFIVLVEQVNWDADRDEVARTIAAQVVEHVQGDVTLNDRRIRVTASIGGGFFPEDGNDLVSLKRSADIAMYHSKNQGRNRFSLFESSMESTALQRLIVQNDLRQALSREELFLVYQPKMDARDDTIIGCEALVRWEHPKEGLLGPDSFIPYAEENGMIRELDYYVLEHACRQACAWDGGMGESFRMAVNLSADHFTDHKIVGKIEEVLSETGFPAAMLEVEVTEAMLIHDPELALEVLTGIRKLGVFISLDDFGVGYSSLNYLRTLPLDVVKLDRTFVQNILTNPHDARLTRGIVALANGLDLDILAEGVETEEQKARLLEIGCHYMQGYYYLRPCRPQEFLQWMGQLPGMPGQPRTDTKGRNKKGC